jgi:ABC-type lipoprotein export system ATPase subunit
LAEQSATLSGVTVNRRDSNGKMFTTLSVDQLSISAGACIGIAGPSGAGKSTLLDVMAGLLLPSSGTVVWGATVLSNLSDRERAVWRRQYVGQVFQEFLLIPELSILANVLLPFSFAHLWPSTDQRQHALGLIHDLGLKDAERSAAVLSRGEQQRVALARALMMRPRILLADEPTASLDQASAALVTELLFDVARRQKATLIIVSHEPAILSQMDQVHQVVAGKLQEAS